MKKVVIMLLILSAGIASCKNNEESNQNNRTVNEGTVTVETIKLKELKNSRVKDVLYAMYWNLMAGKNSEKDSHTFVNKEAYEYLQEVIANEELIVVQKGTCEGGNDCPDTKYKFKIRAKMNRPNYDEFSGVYVQKFVDKEILGWEFIKSLFEDTPVFSSLDDILFEGFESFYMTDIEEVKGQWERRGNNCDINVEDFYFMGQDREYHIHVLPSDKIKYENDKFYIYTVEKILPPYVN